MNKLPLRAINASGNTIADVQLLKVPDAGITAGSGLIDLTASTTPGTGNVGYLNIPINPQSNDYTAVLTDSGKAILETGTSKTITIPANSSVAYPVGTALSFITTAASGASIAITTDTMTLANSSSTGTRTLAFNGVATAIKMTSTTWLINGTGIS